MPALPPPPSFTPCSCPLAGSCSISDNGQVSIMVVRGTQLVQEACQRHQTSPTASAALGRALLGTLLMGAFREAGEKTQVTFKGDGALAGIQIIAGKLDAQAYSGNNQTESVGTSSRQLLCTVGGWPECHINCFADSKGTVKGKVSRD